MPETNPIPKPDVQRIADRAEKIYVERLKTRLEKSHHGMFVAVEPNSGDYFLGATLREAGAAARKAHPGNPAFIMRIGHKAAVHIGMLR